MKKIKIGFLGRIGSLGVLGVFALTVFFQSMIGITPAIAKEGPATIASLEKKLQRLEDIQAIEDLHRNYAYWVCSEEWRKVLDCFTQDAYAKIGVHKEAKGMAQLEELFIMKIGKNNHGKARDGHFATMPVIKVDGDKATGDWIFYIMINDKETGKFAKALNGKHEVEYQKVNGQWKIRKITWLRPWPNPHHVPM